MKKHARGVRTDRVHGLLAGTTRLELANQLIENQPAFHFAFIPETRNLKLFWYRRRDSNPHCLVSKTSASFPLGYAGMDLVQRLKSKVQGPKPGGLWTFDL